uniref:Uncharacterized protein n=1 Tax=Kalanchoe fedtschenkoi TaxID=63787 RepID=A0A7N0U7G6_KALFE
MSIFGKPSPGSESEFPAGHASCSSSSSSIGEDSDLSDGEGGESVMDEAQSKFNGGGAFDSLQALEEVLPMRRGISSFYGGKSKSFASLSCAASVKDLAKAENAYTRRRRNLMASSCHVWDRSHRGAGILRGGVHKKSMRASRSTLALAVAISRSSSSNSNVSSEESSGAPSVSAQLAAQARVLVDY